MSIITAPLLASHLGIQDSDDDASLARAADSTNRAVVRWCGFPLRRFEKTAIADASARFFYPDDQCRLYVTDFWEVTALSVRVDYSDTGAYGTTWVNGTDFIPGPVNALADDEPYTYLEVLNAAYLPTYNRRPAVKVTAAWGWESIHPDVTEAALIKAAKVWKRKDSIDGVLGGFADFGAVRISNREDPTVVELLQPFKRNERAVRIG